MARSYETRDLEMWDARICAKVAEFGLDCYPQEFELCDHNQMLAYMAYSGMPSHYPHWSYGKTFERLKTLYDHGVSGLPYEMVINSSPSSTVIECFASQSGGTHTVPSSANSRRSTTLRSTAYSGISTSSRLPTSCCPGSW